MNKINPLRTILSVVAFLFLSAIIFLLAYLFKGTNFINIFGIVALALLLLIIITNIIILSVRAKRNSKEERLDQMLETVKKYQNEAKDFDFVYQKTIKKLRLSNLIIGVSYSLLIALAICLCSNILTKFHGILIPFIIVVFLAILEITFGLFCIRTHFTPKFDERAKYPYIAKILKECQEELGIDSEVRLYFTFSDDVFVEKTGKNNQLAIGIGIINILSEEELKNVIYHELAHINNNDTIHSSKIVKMSAPFYNFQNPIFVSFGIALLFTSVANQIACEETELFLHFSKFEKEKQADKLVYEKGNKQAYINALAKISVTKFQTDHRFIINVYEETEPHKDYLKWFLNKRKENYCEKEDMYNHFLKHALPLRFDTHPSFAMRMAAFDISEFVINYDFERTNEYQEEIDLANKKFNDDWYKQEKQNWQANREHNYLFYVNEYGEINKKNLTDLSIEDLMKLAFCKRIFNETDDALKICNIILDKQPENVFALQHRAYIKYGKNDLSCIEDFEKASSIENGLVQENDFYIGTIYNNNGMEKEIEEYRKSTLSKMKKEIKNQMYMNKKKEKAFDKHDLDINTHSKIIEELSKYGQIKKAYIIKQHINEDTYRYLVGLVFNKKENIKEIENILSELYLFFETIEDYRFSVGNITFDPYFKSLISRRKIKNELKK